MAIVITKLAEVMPWREEAKRLEKIILEKANERGTLNFEGIEGHERMIEIERAIDEFFQSHPYIVWNVKTGKRIEQFKTMEEAEVLAATVDGYEVTIK